MNIYQSLSTQPLCLPSCFLLPARGTACGRAQFLLVVNNWFHRPSNWKSIGIMPIIPKLPLWMKHSTSLHETSWTMLKPPRSCVIFLNIWTLKNLWKTELNIAEPCWNKPNQHQPTTWAASMLALDDTGTPAWRWKFRWGVTTVFPSTWKCTSSLSTALVFLVSTCFNQEVGMTVKCSATVIIHFGNGMVWLWPQHGTKIKPLAWEPLILSTKYTASSLTAPQGTRMGGSTRTRTCRSKKGSQIFPNPLMNHHVPYRFLYGSVSKPCLYPWWTSK